MFEAAGDEFVTSPRSRGEVEIRASEFRVRGEARCLPTLNFDEDRAPHPNPLPAKSGERERRGSASTAGLPVVALPLEIVCARHQSGDGSNHAFKPAPDIKPVAIN